jgi:hypothetical protein
VEDVRSGDIVFYRTPKSVIAHRVEKIGRNSGSVTVLLLRGDACEHCDDPVLPAQVLGRVVAVEREGRQIKLVGRRAWIEQRLRTRIAGIKSLFCAGIPRATHPNP